MKIRKIISVIDESHSEAGRDASTPLRKVAVAAVCRNPRVGSYSDKLDDLIEGSVEVGLKITKLAAELMQPYPIESYGKGAIVGLAGELEHAEAVLITPFGDTMRTSAGGGKAWICHMAKRAAAGTIIDIPFAHKDALTVRSHYDQMTVMLADAPLPDEIAIICCYANRGRLNERLGGYRVEDIIGKDGLR